jgi:hypothetical protein
MDSDKLKGKEKENESVLVRILPIETNITNTDKFGKKGLMHRPWQTDKTGRFFPSNLTAEGLKPVLAKARVKVENLLLQDDGAFIVYQYKGRPRIMLNLKNGQFYSLSSVIEEFSKDSVQQQAHIVLDILKKYEVSNAVRGKTVFPSSARQLFSKLKTYK